MAAGKSKPIPKVADVVFNVPPFEDEFKAIYEDLHLSGCPLLAPLAPEGVITTLLLPIPT